MDHLIPSRPPVFLHGAVQPPSTSITHRQHIVRKRNNCLSLFSLALLSWWRTLICKVIPERQPPFRAHFSWWHHFMDLRPDIKCNYWDGVFDCQHDKRPFDFLPLRPISGPCGLPDGEVFCFLSSAPQMPRHIDNSSITRTENLSIITYNDF